MKSAAKRFNAALDKLIPSFRRDVAKEKNRYILAQIDAYKRIGRLDEALTFTHEAMLQNIFRKHYLRIFKRSVSQSAELAPQLKSLIPKWQIKREDYEEYLGQWYRGGAADYIYETAKTTENDMRRLMRRAFESELPESEVIKAGLRARGLSAMRADTIARTETHKAAMFASKKSVEDIADQAGVVMVKEWNAVQDERTRISHQEADGQTAEMDEPFQIDGELLDRPADPSGSAENVINCILPDHEIIGLYDLAVKSYYSGKIFKIKTRDGSCVSVTPNHPIATTNGFVAAKNIKVGDNIFSNKVWCDKFIKGNNNNAPPVIQKIYSFIKETGFCFDADKATLDLHGDFKAGDGDVDIVSTNGVLSGDFLNPVEAHSGGDSQLTAPDVSLSYKSRDGSPDLSIGIFSLFSSRFVCGGNLPFDSFGVFFNRKPFNFFSFGLRPYTSVVCDEPSANDTPTNTQSFCDRIFGLPEFVRIDDVVDVEVIDYSGHVYDLQSANGLIIANNIVISNCRCVLTYAVKSGR